jgi:hypothetical protein
MEQAPRQWRSGPPAERCRDEMRLGSGWLHRSGGTVPDGSIRGRFTYTNAARRYVAPVPRTRAIDDALEGKQVFART